MREPEKLTLFDPLWWVTHQEALDDALATAVLSEHPELLDEVATGAHRLAAALATVLATRTDDRLTMSVGEAAKALGFSRRFAYEAIKRNEIPHLRIGKRILVPKAALERLPGESDGSASRRWVVQNAILSDGRDGPTGGRRR